MTEKNKMASGTVVESDLAGPALSLTEGEEERLLDSDREDNTAQSVSFFLLFLKSLFWAIDPCFSTYVTRKISYFLNSFPITPLIS